MTFDLKHAIEILERTPHTLTALLHGISEEWIRSDEGSGIWSPYGIIGHLIHGEKTDWIPRAKLLVSNAQIKRFEPFDRTAQEKLDQSIPLDQLLEEFKTLRGFNLNKLSDLKITSNTLENKGTHPELGEVNLSQLLSAWVVHDLGHISQITRVMAKQYRNEVGVWSKYLGILGA